MEQTKTPPTLDEINERLKSYEAFYGKLHELQIELDKFYELTFDANVPSRFPTRKSSKARDWIDVGVTHFTLDNPMARVVPRRDSDEARKQAGVVETFYNFWMHKDIKVIKNCAKKVLLRGEGFLRVNMDDLYFGSYNGKPITNLSDEERKEYNEKRLFHFPLYHSSPDPINVFCSPAHDGLVPADVFEKFPITAAEAVALSRKNGWNWTTDKKPTQPVSWVSYYDAFWRCFLLDNIPVLQGEVQPNIFGFVPYVHFDSGAGQTSYEGKPEYEYRSLLYGKQDILKMESRMLSMIDVINARYAWLKYKLKGNPELIKQYYPDNKIPTDPDVILIEIPGQMEIEVVTGESPPQGLFQEWGMIQNMASPPAVLGGVKVPGVYSGSFQEDLMSSAKSTYKDAFQNLETALSVSMGMGSRIIEQVYDFPVQIKNMASEDGKVFQEVKPADIKGYYDCTVTLLAEPPEATDVRKSLGKALRQGGSISHKTELLDYHDYSEKQAEDEIAQQAAEEAMKDPLLREVIAKDAMKRLGMQEQLDQITKIENMAKELGNKRGNQSMRSQPPNQTGEGMGVMEDALRTRGRGSPEMGAIPTPREQMGATQ